jgi:hypothetical protein
VEMEEILSRSDRLEYKVLLSIMTWKLTMLFLNRYSSVSTCNERQQSAGCTENSVKIHLKARACDVQVSAFESLHRGFLLFKIYL